MKTMIITVHYDDEQVRENEIEEAVIDAFADEGADVKDINIQTEDDE